MRVRPLALAVASAALLAACSSAGAQAPDWTPKPAFPGDGGGTAIPAQPGRPESSSAQTPPSPSPSSPTTTAPATDPNVVATGLSAPVGLILLPDQTALVGERTTGRILRVQPKPGQPVQTVRTLTGLTTTGDGGLLDLALSPSYDEDNLIFAYITTPTDNRVVDFTLTGPVTPVLTGIPRGATGNTGRIVFGPDGELYIGTGDAGVPANITNQHSLAGKILRVTSIGKPAPGDPVAGSPIVLSGPHEVDGFCTDGTVLLETESRPGAATDLVNQPEPGQLRPIPAPPAPNTGIGGCAVESGVLYVTSRDGHALLGASINTSANIATLAGAWTPYLVNRYGRLRTVVAAPDGALWLTTSNRDGHGSPVAADERVLRIQPPAQSGSASPV